MPRFFKKDTRQALMALAHLSSMGLALAIAIVLGLALGLWVDNTWSTEPWGFFIGLALGIVAGFRNVYIIAKRAKVFDDD